MKFFAAKIVLGCALVTIAFSSSQAQVTSGDQVDAFLNPAFPSGFQYRGAGARALAMGYAFSAMSDDITALTWNPAGLIGVEKATLGLEYRKVGGNGKVASPQSDISFSGSLNGIGLISFGMPIRLRNHPFGLGLTIDRPIQEDNTIVFHRSRLRDNSPFDADPTMSEYSATTLSEAHENVLRVMAGFGTRISGPLTAGISLTFYSGNGSHHILNTYTLRNYEDPTANISVVNQKVTYQPTLGTDDTSSYSGNAIEIGLRYVKPDFKLAALIRPAHTMRFTYDYLLSTDVYVNGKLENAGFNGLYRDDQVSDFHVPLMVTLGGAVNVSKELTVAADFESRFFGNSVYNRRINRVISNGPTVETFQEFDPQYQDAISLRLGGEYWLQHQTDNSPGLALRAGFRSDGMAAPEGKATIVDTVPVATFKSYSETSFSLGAGVWWSQIRLDAGVSFTSFTNSSDVTSPDVYTNVQSGITDFSVVPVEYKANFPTFRLTFTGVF